MKEGLGRREKKEHNCNFEMDLFSDGPIDSVEW